MSGNRFRKAAKSIQSSPFVVPLTLVFIAMLVVSFVTSYEDFTTSRLGYALIPTAKSGEAVIWAVALVPQLGQIGFAYAYASAQSRPWMLAVVGSLHVVDVSTDVYFKAYGRPALSWVIAFFESEALYTIGSEIMLVTSFGMLVYLMPDFVEKNSW
jgi:hypothetical protein